MSDIFNWFKKNVLYIAWFQALVAMLGSLYYSEIQHLPPCVLCWYQRIFMYPLVFIITAGILLKDKKIHIYVLPLSLIGLTIAVYHVALQFGLIPQSAVPCLQGVSCTTKLINYLGFITIPFLSMLAFALISICMLIFKKEQSKR